MREMDHVKAVMSIMSPRIHYVLDEVVKEIILYYRASQVEL
jgi:hypothetical protein